MWITFLACCGVLGNQRAFFYFSKAAKLKTVAACLTELKIRFFNNSLKKGAFMKTILSLLTFSLFASSSAFATPADDLAQEKQLSSAYLEKMATEANAKTIEQGIVIRPIYESNSGQFAKATDTVKVSYHLVDREGNVVDESITSDELAVFPLNKLIKCWQIAIPQISIGSFYKITCPSDVAYGDKGTGDGAIKGGAALTFRLTVYGIQN
jgi:FKBP-type peptidyl-prolyl cis-trans isomerase FkpA/FKBP-type peptidyl-prolyl cis-trans isomerase FklB